MYEAASFEEFWPHYVRLHTRPQTQWLHALATSSAATLIALALLGKQPLFLLLFPIADYALAQTSHRMFEKNRSTPWRNVHWHARAELKMFRLVVLRRMQAEVALHVESSRS
jgi:hypothetical protein